MFDLEYRLDGEGDLRWLSDRCSSQKTKVHFHNKQDKYNKGLSRKKPPLFLSGILQQMMEWCLI
jgi:hypothetical protein